MSSTHLHPHWKRAPCSQTLLPQQHRSASERWRTSNGKGQERRRCGSAGTSETLSSVEVGRTKWTHASFLQTCMAPSESHSVPLIILSLRDRQTEQRSSQRGLATYISMLENTWLLLHIGLGRPH